VIIPPDLVRIVARMLRPTVRPNTRAPQAFFLGMCVNQRIAAHITSPFFRGHEAASAESADTGSILTVILACDSLKSIPEGL
jgi:hypothetical protein